MRRLKLTLLSLAIFSSLACASIPFSNIEYVSLDNLTPHEILNDFSSRLAPRMSVVNSIVFQYKWRSFAALGYTQVDREQGTFQVSCFNPVGIKLFELTGDRSEIKPTFVLKELLEKGDLPQAVGEDIRRIYFEMLPAPASRIDQEKYRVVFIQPVKAGYLKYVFAGSKHLLFEKQYFENNHKLWTVYYYNYIMDRGQLYPSQILLKHYRFGYNLIVRLKEVR